MPAHDFTAPRLFVDAPLFPGAEIACNADQANYLLNVLRFAVGDEILLFNGRDGEWRATLTEARKRGATLTAAERIRPQDAPRDLHYIFAPLKRSRLDYMIQKAVELGVTRLRPALTRRTIVERVNLDRMRANAIEAAEQCGTLGVPVIDDPARLDAILAAWEPERRLVFCDERADGLAPLAALASLKPGPLAVLIGPEGGFAPEERDALLSKPFTTVLPLGPRIMRADTAAVAALALVNSVAGDWR
jgi:16S rRNA (uracil1498-N3)-methyltransferase